MKKLYLALAIAIAGCTTAIPKSQTTVTRGEPAPGCAFGIEGTTATAEDTMDGIALTFTNVRDAKEVRERAFDASAMYGPGAKFGKGHEGKHGDGGHHGLQMMQLPPMTAAMTEVEGGARIRFTPNVAADLETLRTKLRERAHEMTTKPCK